MKISFYLDNSKIQHVDFSQVEEGNPGCGGTEYSIVSCVHALTKMGLPTKLFVTNFGNFPSIVQFKVVENFEFACIEAAKLQTTLIYKPSVYEKDIRFNLSDDTKCSLAPWLHITPTQKQLREMAQDYRVKVIIAIGNNQALRILDNPAWEKTIVLENPISFLSASTKRSDIKLGKRVTFIGALVPAKGFHLLAEVWPKVLKEIPEARLSVIGSAKLHGSVSTKIASEKKSSYEDTVIRLLGDSVHSVDFLGLLDHKKITEVLLCSNVGVINPSGETEVMSGSALEMQSLGVPVISRRKFGMVDVVRNGKTGFLVRSKRGLKKSIIELLKDEKKREFLSENAINFVKEEFKKEEIVNKWVRFFEFKQSLKEVEFKGNSVQSVGIRGLAANLNRGLQIKCNYKLLTIQEYTEIVLSARNFLKRNLMKAKAFLVASRNVQRKKASHTEAG